MPNPKGPNSASNTQSVTDSWVYLRYMLLAYQPRLKAFFANITLRGSLYESFVAACAENFDAPQWTVKRSKGFSCLLTCKRNIFRFLFNRSVTLYCFLFPTMNVLHEMFPPLCKLLFNTGLLARDVPYQTIAETFLLNTLCSVTTILTRTFHSVSVTQNT